MNMNSMLDGIDCSKLTFAKKKKKTIVIFQPLVFDYEEETNILYIIDD